MTATTETASATPKHYWVVAILAVLWNGFGAVDYTMSHLQQDAWFSAMGVPEAVALAMDAYPSWMHAVWAIGVWGSVLGTVFLLLRKRWAFHAFAVSTLGAVGSLIYTAMTPAIMEAMGIVMPAVIVVICLFFVWYSQQMTKQGVLR